MQKAISEMYRVLKPNGWLTIMFHNSSDKIWQELQRAISASDFKIDGTVIFDKVHGTFKQFVSENAVGFDLLLNCRKKEHPAGVVIPQTTMKEFTIVDIEQFILERLSANNLEYYTSHFEHVSRCAEFNFRKLYSEWLAKTVDKEMIGIDFEHFRFIADGVLKGAQNVLSKKYCLHSHGNSR